MDGWMDGGGAVRNSGRGEEFRFGSEHREMCSVWPGASRGGFPDPELYPVCGAGSRVEVLGAPVESDGFVGD